MTERGEPRLKRVAASGLLSPAFLAAHATLPPGGAEALGRTRRGQVGA